MRSQFLSDDVYQRAEKAKVQRLKYGHLQKALVVILMQGIYLLRSLNQN